MNYTKPEVEVLGLAKNVIEQPSGSKGTSSSDGTTPDGPGLIGPAYDLDE